MREIEVSDNVSLSELVKMLKATHMYINKKKIYLNEIKFTFREETGCEREIRIGIKSSDLL